MNDKEFQKLNRRVHQKQAQAAKERERQSAAKISESCTILLNNLESRPQKCQRCGGEDGELITQPQGGRYSLLCNTCDHERKNYEAEREKKDRRTSRRIKAQIIKSNVDYTIPPAYRKARLWKLGSKFKKSLLRYNFHTGVVLYGPTGTGKTFALCALLRSLIAKGLNCKRIGYEMLCLKIRQSFRPDSNLSELDTLRPFIEADVLLLEDLGCSKPLGTAESDFSLRVIYTLLDARLEQERLTLVSTNKTLEAMKTSFDERIASRLSALMWLGVGGQDKRTMRG